MSTKIASLFAEIGADTKGLERGLANTQSGLASVTKGFLGAMGPALSFAAVGAAVAKGLNLAVTSASEAETANVKLASSLFSSGRGAEIGAAQIDRFATSLMAATGIDDEAIKDAYTAIAGFENLPTDKMDDVVKIAADMAAMFGGDLASNAASIAGVLETWVIPRIWRFDKALKAQIQSQGEAGDTAGALSLMMDELSRRYGGQAVTQMNTYAGSVRASKTAMGEFWEAVGQGLVGPGQNFNTWLAKNINILTQNIDANNQTRLATKMASEELARGWWTVERSSLLWGEYNKTLETTALDYSGLMNYGKAWEKWLGDQPPKLDLVTLGLGAQADAAAKATIQFGGLVDIAKGFEPGMKGLKPGEIMYDLLKEYTGPKGEKLTQDQLADFAIKNGLMTQEAWNTAKELEAAALKAGEGYTYPIEQLGAIKSGLSGIAGMANISKVITLTVMINGHEVSFAGINPASLGLTPLGGGRASGGPVMGGGVYPVGEKGPELFVPNTAGRIIPNDQLPAKGDTHYHHNNYYGPVNLSVPKEDSPWQEL